jgi:hypothetical protein
MLLVAEDAVTPRTVTSHTLLGVPPNVAKFFILLLFPASGRIKI